jgi:hypothetical protein
VTGVAFARRKQVLHADDPDQWWFMLTVVFEADAVGDPDDLSIGDDEVEEARWFGERPDQIAEFVREQADGWNWPDGS